MHAFIDAHVSFRRFCHYDQVVRSLQISHLRNTIHRQPDHCIEPEPKRAIYNSEICTSILIFPENFVFYQPHITPYYLCS